MQKKLLWFCLPAAAAAAVGAGFWLLKKTGSRSVTGNKSAGTGAPLLVKNPKTGTYSFISGFKNAVTVELAFSYDADRFSWAVVEEDFLAESGDSHVGILMGEAFSMQMEYASYYNGEDFASLTSELKEKHPELVSASYGAWNGVQYLDGDNMCIALPIPDDAFSYLLITLVKASDNDDDVSALPDYPDVTAILASLQISGT